MSSFIKLSATAAILFFAVLFYGCEKDVKDIDYGNTYIFMPQATLSNLNYAVPAGRDSASYNFRIEGNKVKVILGVSRGGKTSGDGYSVNVAADADTVTSLLNANILNPATTQVLPSSIYSLPATVDVPAGSDGATFYLTIDKTQLKTYAGKKLALGVVVKDPSKYMLNAALNKVVVIIDVAALKL